MADEDNKYDVLEKIGHGSFGVIRKVRRKCDNQILCRKEISYTRMSQKEREQLQAELSILKELHHPNIVRYYERDHLKESQDLHLYMEYCGNGDLGRLIKNLKIKNQYAEEEFVWSVFSQMLSALYRCHYGENAPDVGHDIMGLGNNAKPLKSKQNMFMILHRDLKPENVFLGEDNSVKLGDFGLSKILQSHDFASTYVGTPFYMSPEICSAERYTLHSDIWSLGCIIHELCAKEPPFNAKTHVDLINKIRAGRVERIPACYSGELQKVIDSCLQTNPSHRPSTAQLLNLPIIKLMRKEQEVVILAQQMKHEKDQATRALKELNSKMTRIELQNTNIRVEIDAAVRREWEVKARLEIDRQVQLEMERLERVFEGEVSKRVAQELDRRLTENSSSDGEFVRSLTPTMEADEDKVGDSSDNHGKSHSTLGSRSDFPSQTDLSDLSLESPDASRPSFRPTKRPTRTPFTRAKTMFQQGSNIASPMDVQMAEPSPMGVGALSLSPRRLPIKRNLFQAPERWEPKIPESPSDLPSDDDDVDADFLGDDELPTLPSPTRPRKTAMADDPFKTFNPIQNKPTLNPTHRLGSAPNLLAPTGAVTATTAASTRPRPTSTVPVVATSPNRRKSKMPLPTECGSPTRKLGPNAPAGTSVKDFSSAFAPTAASTLKSKRGNVDEMRQIAMRKNLQGRTLVELSQGRAPLSDGSYGSDSGDDGKRRTGTRFAAEWDPERDEMPSPFLARGASRGRGILPHR
ncbi:kinase-like protein [Pseudovirgaria hyperparasitica]|uniref:non-specific serine/threonine protein kinase n=1 Tax=Pseudovirgaria hyperparasitica TaxID=470096 RepID=A0A6A6VTS3_9PEZI|nr:kinase-like protein [Pseudovirgaria hyperparasitica]KAF2753289.1 kinase-like protein [Pseudovirgaria hyperparasitica]